MPDFAPLPVDPLIPDLVDHLAGHPCAVLLAPPGAGKTTRVPPALLAGRFLSSANNAVVLLQPRRVAARAVAARIAQERGWTLGEEVGYHIRFDNRTAAQTRVRVLTEGILTRMIQSDPFLEGIGCVILDEFHERSIHTDLALSLLREIQRTVREDLRLVVMSATMDPTPVARFLGAEAASARVFESRGRLFDVKIDYLARPDESPVWTKTADAVRQLSREPDAGHILAFLPGIGEIRRTAGLLHDLEGELHVLHSSVSAEEQDRAMRPSPKRKIILATNIAETSLTIDGVRTVIDAGLVRVMVNDARLGIDRLELRRVSRASATQRAGRAGRTAPGRCLRLWTRSEDAALEEQETPEIHRIDLASTALALRAFGVGDPARFDWFEPPRPDALERAERLLTMLGATQCAEPAGNAAASSRLTDVGRQLAMVPLHPRIGRLVLAGARAGMLREAATLAALLAEKEILAEGHQARRRDARLEGSSDLLVRLDLLEYHRSSPDLDPQAVRNVERVRDELIMVIKRLVPRMPHAAQSERECTLLKLLLHAYPDRLTVRREADPARGVMVGGRGVVLEPSSIVRRAPLFLSIDPRDVEVGWGSETRVGLASAVDPEWLGEVFPHLLGKVIEHRFDPGRSRVLSLQRTIFAGLALREDVVGPQADPKGAAQAFAHHLSQHPDLLLDDEDVARWLARLRFLRRFMPELGLPEFNTDELDETLRQGLQGEWSGCTALSQIRARGLKRLLEGRLTWAQRASLEEHAPEALAVPSGSRIRLLYSEAGPPALAVRLQELFGLAETPRLAGGRAPVQLQLLAPNYRPVQVTSDLKSFWNGAYREVRRDLRARYPKHPWPEDPWNAIPVSVGRRRK